MKRKCLLLLLLFQLFAKTVFAQSEIFVENKGQFASKVKAFAALNIGNVWLCDDGLWFHFWNTEKIMELHDRNTENAEIPSHAVQLKFSNGKINHVRYTGSKSSHYVNYLKGNDASKWASKIYLYSSIIVNDIYDGVDL